MGKKNKPPAVPTSEHSKLTHSPFATLGARGVASAPPAATESVVSAPTAAAADGGTAPIKPGSLGRLVLRRETKHRGGKAVVIVSGFSSLGFSAAALEALATDCKRTLGCGGTVDEGEIALQGDRAAEVAELLRRKGFRVAGVTS